MAAEKNGVGDHASNRQHMPETAEQAQELTVSSSLQIGSTKHGSKTEASIADNTYLYLLPIQRFPKEKLPEATR